MRCRRRCGRRRDPNTRETENVVPRLLGVFASPSISEGQHFQLSKTGQGDPERLARRGQGLRHHPASDGVRYSRRLGSPTFVRRSRLAALQNPHPRPKGWQGSDFASPRACWRSPHCLPPSSTERAKKSALVRCGEKPSGPSSPTWSSVLPAWRTRRRCLWVALGSRLAAAKGAADSLLEAVLGKTRRTEF